MPRHVDHEVRRREIVDATMKVLSRSGTRGLSLRAVAAEMGGSTTLITHYFPTQQELLDEVTAQLLAGWDGEIAALDAESETPFSRLEALLRWMLPLTEESLQAERSRISLLEGQLLGEENRVLFQGMESKIRELFRSHVSELVSTDEIEQIVELLRVTTNGVVLSVLEHPDAWPPERQLAILDWLLDSLGLTERAGAPR